MFEDNIIENPFEQEGDNYSYSSPTMNDNSDNLSSPKKGKVIINKTDFFKRTVKMNLELSEYYFGDKVNFKLYLSIIPQKDEVIEQIKKNRKSYIIEKGSKIYDYNKQIRISLNPLEISEILNNYQKYRVMYNSLIESFVIHKKEVYNQVKKYILSLLSKNVRLTSDENNLNYNLLSTVHKVKDYNSGEELMKSVNMNYFWSIKKDNSNKNNNNNGNNNSSPIFDIEENIFIRLYDKNKNQNLTFTLKDGEVFKFVYFLKHTLIHLMK